MYRVQLQNFEGPLDLLLFFIKRDELDIYDIPIAYITEQFFEYIHFLDELDLSVASEFILMASTLMAIKARMMLPRDEELEEDEEADPRYELVRALLEYKRYKEMAEDMHVLEQRSEQRYFRGNRAPDVLEPDIDHGEVLKSVTMFDLMAAFKNVMQQVKKEKRYHRVERLSINIDEQIVYLLNLLKDEGRKSFLDICLILADRMKIVVTFLACLELIKQQKLFLFMKDEPTDFSLEFNPEQPEPETVTDQQ